MQRIKWFLTKLPPAFEYFMIFCIRIVFYYPFFRGNKYICPCCGKGSKKFMRIKSSGFKANTGQIIENNALCTYCCSLPRQRAVCYYLSQNNNEVINPGSDRIILFAPEPCIQGYFKKSGIACKTSDLFRKGCDLQLDLCNIDLPDNSQDLVICNHILEHVPDDGKAMSELSRIITDKGIALIMTPMDLDLEATKEEDFDSARSSISLSEYRKNTFGQFDHVRLYGRDFIERLKTYFSVEIFDGSTINQYVMPKFGPFELDVNNVFVCKKKA